MRFPERFQHSFVPYMRGICLIFKPESSDNSGFQTNRLSTLTCCRLTVWSDLTQPCTPVYDRIRTYTLMITCLEVVYSPYTTRTLRIRAVYAHIRTVYGVSRTQNTSKSHISATNTKTANLNFLKNQTSSFCFATVLRAPAELDDHIWGCFRAF